MADEILAFGDDETAILTWKSVLPPEQAERVVIAMDDTRSLSRFKGRVVMVTPCSETLHSRIVESVSKRDKETGQLTTRDGVDLRIV